MELQSFRSIFAIIAIIAVVIELVTFFRKFPKPSELAFSTLVNFGIINFVVFESGFRSSKITLVLGVLAYVGLLLHLYFWINFNFRRKKSKWKPLYLL